MSITLKYTAVAPLVEANLKQAIKADLRKRLQEVVTEEIEAVIEETVRDIVARVSEVRDFGLDGITLQVAINGVKKEAQPSV